MSVPQQDLLEEKQPKTSSRSRSWWGEMRKRGAAVSRVIAGAHPSITEAGERRRAQLSAWVAFVLAVAYLVGMISSTLAHRVSTLAGWTLMGLGGVTIVAYVLARTPYAAWSGWVMTGGLLLGGYAYVWSGQGTPTALASFVPLAFVLGSILLSTWSLFFWVVAAIVMLFLTPPSTGVDAGTMSGIYVSLGSLLLIAVTFRNSVERTRLAELRRANADLQQANARIQESAQRVTTVFRTLVEGVGVTDVNGNFLEVNDSLARMLGYAKADELIGENVASFLAEDDRPKAAEILTARNVLGQTAEYRMLDRNGRLVDAELTVSALVDETGQPSGFVMVLRDVTQQKRIAETIRQSEARQRQILDTIPASILISRLPGGEVLYANQTLANQFGVSLDQLIGHTMPDLYAELQDRTQVLDTLHEQGYLNHYVSRSKRLDNGQSFWTDLSGRMIDFGGENALLLSFMDITAVKQAEAEITRERAFSNEILDGLPGVFYLFDPQGKLVRWNRNYQEIIGYRADEFASATFLDGIVAEDREAMAAAIQKAFTEGQASVEAHLQSRNGPRIPYFFTARRIQSGEQTFVAGAGYDISDRKQLERQIQESLDRRGYQVRVSTQIAQEISASPQLTELFRRVVSLVKEQFGYYHTQLLMLDPAQNQVRLVVGYGEIGEKMLAAGHQMPLGVGLIGLAAATKQTVVRPALANDPDWRPNPLLPETRGEIAVPIILRGEVLGVLDVQSDRENAITQDDQLLLEGLCGQIAIAIEDTRLRREMEEHLYELNSVTQALSSQGWRSFEQISRIPAYVYEETAGQAVPLPEVENLVQQIGENAYTAPLSLRGGQAIGALKIVQDPAHPLTEQERALVEQVAEQVSLALDSARLFAQTQTALSETRESEQLIRTIIDSTPDWIFVKDRDHRFRMVNQAYANSLHRDPAEIIGKDDIELGFPEELVKGDPQKGIAGFWADDDAVMNSGEPKNVPNDYVMLDGEMHIFNTYKAPLRDAEGRVWGVLGVARDVTERERIQQAILQRARELSQVAGLGTTISSILDPAQMLQTVADLTKETFSLYHAHLYLLNERNDALTLVAGAGEVGRQMVGKGWKIPLEHPHSLVARAARSRQGVIVNDVRAEPDYLPNELLPETRAELAVPLLVGDRVMGVLDIQSAEINHFTEEDVSIFLVLASQVAVALQNARTYAQTQRQAEYEALINAISQRIQSTTTVESALQVAVRELGRALGASKASVQLGLTRSKK